MWDKINVGFNAEEETANFGTRACAVNDVSVYETNTLAAILAGLQKPTNLPVVYSQFFPRVGLCVAIDSSLTLFNEDCSALKCSVNFSSNIQVFTVSPSGVFLLVGSNGVLKCFHISTDADIVFTRTITSNSDLVNFVTIDCYEESALVSIVVVLSNGQIYQSSKIDFSKLEDACKKKVISVIEELTEDITFQEVFKVNDLKSQVQTAVSLIKERQSVFLSSLHNIYMLDVRDCNLAVCELLEGFRVVKIGGVVNDSVLFALCDNGLILQICLHTMTPYYLWNEFSVNDFVVLEGSAAYECNLLALFNEPMAGQQAVALISWPDWKVKFKLPVEDKSFLIQQRECEEILFLEGFGNGGLIDTVRIKAIIESLPELRLARILRRCKFEEAEKFAIAFSLDLEIVYKAHIQKLTQDMWLPSPLDHQKKIFNKILELIEKIRDHNFVAEICVTAIPPDFTMLHTMLMYGTDRFSKVTDKSGDNLSELLARVSTIARRLDTCMLIHGANTTVDHWLEFPKHDLVESCVSHIKRGEIEEAVLVWSRHLSDMKPFFTLNNTMLLLNGIPKTTKLEELLLWFHHFIPPILTFFPSTLSNIVEWTIQRARDLEMINSGSWPASGLELAKCLLRLVHTPPTEKSFLKQSQRVALRNENLSHHSPLNYLLQLISTLKDISTLKETYCVIVHYDQFVQEDHNGFVAALLERIPTEKISMFMEELFPRLMMERSLDPDLQILNFIQDIVMNCEDWWYWDEAPWEARVSALMPHIHNIQFRLDAILHVLKSAPVPWTPVVSQLAEQGVCLPHIKANDVQNEISSVPKRLIMKKYGIMMINQEHEMRLVRLILKKNQKSMLEDINELARCVKGNVSELYLIVIIHFIENRNENSVAEIFKFLSEDCKMECTFQLTFHIHRLITHRVWEKLEAYFTAIPENNSEKDKQLLCTLKTMHHIKLEFDLTTNSKITTYVERQEILEDYADKLVKEVISGELPDYKAIKKVARLAHLLSMTAEEAFTILASVCVTHDLRLALTFSSKIEDLEKKPKVLYKKVSILVGLLVSYYKPLESSGLLIEMFSTVTNHIARKFLSYSDECDLDTIFKWVSLLNCSSASTKSALKLVYGDPASTPATAILVHSSVQNIIQCYVNSCRKNHKSICESLNSAVSHTSDVEVEGRHMMALWQRLREEQQDLSCIRLVYEFCWSQKVINPSFQENSYFKFLTQCIKDLLRKLFRLRNFDLDLALQLLHFFTKEEVMTFLVEEAQSVSFNYQRLSCISQLALAYCSINKIDKYTKAFCKYHVCCRWAKKLNELGLPHKDAFKETDSERRQLVVKLMSLPSTTIPLLKEFCMDMFFDLQECLMMYLEYLLLNWEPDIVISTDPSNGEEVIKVKNGHEELQQQCRAILHQLGTKSSKSDQIMSWNESIQNELSSLWLKVNYYYYEVYVVLVDLYQRVLVQPAAIKQINSYKHMLDFLQSYKRISSPSESEQDKWFQLFPNTNQLPPISKYRLPFAPFFEKEPPWKILKPELSLKTYKIWYDIVPSLGLDQDMLCLLTIQRLTSEQLAGGSKKKDKSSWSLQACNESVLLEIQECVRNIHNQEMASAALYYVVNHMPPGADQVAAANMCYRQAEQWINQANCEASRTGFAKVQKKYLTVCTSHILHSSGLGRSEYLQLVLLPQELICALYNDPSILQRKSGTISHIPDINRVVIEIGQLHGVNVLGIQQELLSEWLYPPDNPPLDMSCDDITQNIAAALHNNISVPADNDSIIRACFVLESMEMETAAKYLVNYAGIRDDLECRPTVVRLRALQCLCTITTADVVVQVTGTSIETIKANMQNLMFISELEKLGLVWSIKGFEACDKEDVVRVLLTKASPHAVQLAAALGCFFKLANVLYWNQILQLMTSYTMVEELAMLLPELTHLCHLLDSLSFTAAWNCALITPLLKVEYPLSEESKYRVQRALEMLYCCPIPRQVDLTLMLSHCQRLRDDEFVTRLQPFISLTQLSHQTLTTKQ